MSSDNGGPAFPEIDTYHDTDRDTREPFSHVQSAGGMSLRDYFAAKALPASLAEFYRTGGPGETWSDYGDFAEHIYGIADAMLKARQK